MKRSKRTRKIHIGILNILFLASAVLFYEVHTNIFIKDLAENEITNMLPVGMKAEIGRIKGGITSDLISEDVKILMDSGDAHLLTIKRIDINYRLWQPLLKKIQAFSKAYDKNEIVLLIGEDPIGPLEGFFKLEKTPEEFDIWGYIGDKKEDRIFVIGTLKKEAPSHIKIVKRKSTINLKIEKEKRDVLKIEGKIDHFKWKGIDFVSNLIATIDSQKSSSTNIDLLFKDIILNYEPFQKTASISFINDKTKGTVDITKFNIGDEIKGYGYTRLTSEHYTFLRWTFTNLKLEDYLKPRDIKEGISGIMNGKFNLKGPIKEASLSGHFDIQKGHIGNTKFDSIIVNLKGKGPLISVYDSRMRKEDGYMTLDGEIDLTKLDDKNAFDNLFFDADENSFIWEGWSVKKEKSNASLKAEKALDDELNISFESHSEEETGEEEHFLGVEHKVKF